MTKTFLITVFTVSFLLIPMTYGYDEEHSIVNLANDFAKCSAYYIYGAAGVRKTGNEKTAKRMEEAAAVAYDYSVKFSNQKVTEARITLALEQQRKETDHSFSNFSILILKYSEMCKEALEVPEKRLNYWRNKKE